MREELKAAGYDDVKASIQADLDEFIAEHGDVQFVREEGASSADTTAASSESTVSTSSSSAAE